jgi:hypothetical protein
MVREGDPDHVLDRAGLQDRHTPRLEGTRVRDHDQLRALQHQHARGLGEQEVEADHGP